MFNNILGDSGDSLLFFFLLCSSCMLRGDDGLVGGIAALATMTAYYSSSYCW